MVGPACMPTLPVTQCGSAGGGPADRGTPRRAPTSSSTEYCVLLRALVGGDSMLYPQYKPTDAEGTIWNLERRDNMEYWDSSCVFIILPGTVAVMQPGQTAG